MASTSTVPTTITEQERLEVERANQTGRTPVVFIHGLWLLPSSWDRWAAMFSEAGYVALTPGWPDDPDTVAEANANPDVFAHKTVGQVADHFDDIISGLATKPAIIGHSFGGLLTQILAGRGLAAASVAIDPAPFRGVLPLPVLGNPIFQAAAANLNPWTEVRVDSENPARGPMLVVSGEKDHTVPHAVSHAAFEIQKRNLGLTEFAEIPNRGHALTIDSGWKEVATIVLNFVRRFARA